MERGEKGLLPNRVAREESLTQSSRHRPWSFEAFLLRYSSAHTRRAYAGDWSRFCEEIHRWFGISLSDATVHGLHLLTEDLVLAWLRNSETLDAGLTQAERAGRIETRRRMLASLAAYCRFLVRKRVFEHSPLEFLPKVAVPRAAHQRSSALSPDEMRRLLSDVEKCRNVAAATSIAGSATGAAGKANQLRLQASLELTEVVVWTLLTVGMRVSELTGLRICDFVEENGLYRLRMNLKGGQEHDPLIHPITAEKIRKYIIQYRHNATAYAPLFVRAQRVRSERPLSQYGVFKIVSRAMEMSGMDKKISPHGLRATLATALVKQRVPLVQIKDLLGHRSIHTTNIYVKRASETSDAAALKLDIPQLFGNVAAQGTPAPTTFMADGDGGENPQEDHRPCNTRLT